MRRNQSGWRRLQRLVILLLVCTPLKAAAARQEPAPGELEGVGVSEKLGTRLPGTVELVDESGRSVRLGELLGRRPLILTLNYYSCPMLCTLQLNGLVEALRAQTWSPGREFEIVTVSINPLEGPALAAAKKQSYLEALGRPGAASGWHFMTGSEAAVRTLASSVGVSYRFVPSQAQYAHPAVAILLTPDGVVSRYLEGVQIDPGTLRLALAEAGRGTVGTRMDQVLLLCFRYDAHEGRYVVAAMRLMRLAGGVTVLALAAALAVWWRGQRRRSTGAGRPAPPGQEIEGAPG